MSLKSKLIITFLALLLAPLFLLGIFNHYHVKALIQEQTIKPHHAFIFNKVQGAEAILQKNINDILFLQSVPAFLGIVRSWKSGYDPLGQSSLQQWKNRVTEIAARAFYINKNWGQIICLNTQGDEIVRAIPMPQGVQFVSDGQLQNRASAYYFKEALKLGEGEVAISYFTLEEENGKDKLVIYYSVPLGIKNDAPEGVLVVSYQVSSLLDELGQTSMGHIILTDQDGYFIVHPDEKKKLSAIRGTGDNYFKEQPELLNNSRKLKFKDHHDTDDKQHRVWRKISYDPYHPEKYWILFSVIPEKILFASMNQLRDLSLMIGLLVLIIGTLVVWMISQTLTKPFKKLIEGAKIIGKGNLDHRFGSHRLDEVGELSTAFDQMVENLKALTVSHQYLFEHASLGILIANSEGIMEQVNPYLNQLFGYEGLELVGQKVEVLIPKKIREKHIEHRAQYNHAPKSRPMGLGMDLWGVKKDGTEFPVEISLAHYEVSDERQIVCFINNITERKKAEETLKKLNIELEKKVEERTNDLSQAIMELQHTNENLQNEMEQRKKAEEEARQAFEKEKELSELKSRFVSMASHEFRTPLAGILTSISLIDKYHHSSDEPKRSKHIQTIKTSVQNLTNILNDFLSLDKLEQGKIICHPTSFLLTDFIKELAEEMEVISDQKERIRYEHRGDTGFVQLDKEIFKNVLINLLSNAMKYSAPEKKVHLTTELKDQTLTLTIRDEGIGIPKGDQKHLFETFFRAHNVTTIQGTGLGLNIVKRYLDLMGGTIEFVSQENVGTTFKVMIPITPPNPLPGLLRSRAGLP